MSTITLPNIRVSSDLTIRLKLKDGGVAIDWPTLQNIRVSLYADDQRSMASRCSVSIDEEDSTILVCQYAANKMQYLGVNRVIVQCKYMGEVKTYDKPAFNFVRWTSDQEGEQITIDDPDVDVEISVEDVSSSILQEAVDAAFSAADRANDAAEAAEHMVDIHTGPEGKSAYEVAVEKGYTGTEEEWLASLKGPVGETPDISIGTVTTVEPGTPASASMSGTPEAPVLNLSIPKGAVGSTPNISIGTVTTGAPGTPVVITITGTAEAPVLNITIPQGMKGDTGVSADYPITIYNGLDSDATDAALSAAQGKVLDGKVSQLQQKVTDLELPVNGGKQAITYIDGEYVNQNTGVFTHYAGWSRTDYINVKGQATLEYSNPDADTIYNAFYDKDKVFISSFRTIKTSSVRSITVPTGAEFAILSNTSTAIRQLTLPNLREYAGIDAIEIKVNEIDETISKSQDICINTATSINDIEVYAIDLNTRIDFILPILLNARVQISTNSGYQVSYSLQKADGTTLYDSAWLSSINLQGTLYNYPTTSRIRLYFRKSDSSATSISDIKANAVSEMVVDYVTKEWNVRPDLTIDNSILKDIHNLAVGGNGILDLNPEKEVVPRLGNLTRRYISYGGSATEHPPVLSFIHMSDAHADNENILRIKAFYDQYKENYIKGGVIDTGDFIGQNLANGLPTSISEVPDFIRILGNHDAYYYVDGSWQLAPQLDCYNVCFKDYIGEWGVVQPENAAANGYCYFYKDFAENGVMMVALDYDHWDATQNTWLVNTLAVARTNARHVIILVHRAPFRITADTNNPFQNVDYINRTFADHSPMTDVYTAVKNFIDAGGTFVCYLCGHLHDDYFGLGRDADTSNQLVIGVGCASGKTSATVSGTMSRIAGQRSQDCFNVVGIDTTSKTIKIMRIGANYDRYMRKKNTLSWNYGTGQLIYVD